MYAGKTRSEVAGYDDAFMQWVLCRRRDDSGGLVRTDPDLPRWVTENLDSTGQWVVRNPKPFGTMFHQVMKQRGLTEQERIRAWQEWKAENPAYDEGGSFDG